MSRRLITLGLSMLILTGAMGLKTVVVKANGPAIPPPQYVNGPAIPPPQFLNGPAIPPPQANGPAIPPPQRAQ
jgi:hypothetical protein